MGAEAYRTIYEWFDIVWVFSLLFYIVFFFDGYPPPKQSVLALLCVSVCGEALSALIIRAEILELANGKMVKNGYPSRQQRNDMQNRTVPAERTRSRFGGSRVCGEHKAAEQNGETNYCTVLFSFLPGLTTEWKEGW